MTNYSKTFSSAIYNDHIVGKKIDLMIESSDMELNTFEREKKIDHGQEDLRKINSCISIDTLGDCTQKRFAVDILFGILVPGQVTSDIVEMKNEKNLFEKIS
ncbi:hypothetical protein BDC45DRAFT_534536 [Circinella umbellata]|nr:hypothetical protein BDC45DRAFT_534536 [Circinella umbellata]